MSDPAQVMLTRGMPQRTPMTLGSRLKAHSRAHAIPPPCTQPPVESMLGCLTPPPLLGTQDVESMLGVGPTSMDVESVVTNQAAGTTGAPVSVRLDSLPIVLREVLTPFDVDSNGVVVESELAKVFHRVLAHTVLHTAFLSLSRACVVSASPCCAC